MNEHDDDVEPEVEEGDLEIEEFPIADEDDESVGEEVDEGPEIDPDKSEI